MSFFKATWYFIVLYKSIKFQLFDIASTMCSFEFLQIIVITNLINNSWWQSGLRLRFQWQGPGFYPWLGKISHAAWLVKIVFPMQGPGFYLWLEKILHAMTKKKKKKKSTNPQIPDLVNRSFHSSSHINLTINETGMTLFPFLQMIKLRLMLSKLVSFTKCSFNNNSYFGQTHSRVLSSTFDTILAVDSS